MKFYSNEFLVAVKTAERNEDLLERENARGKR